ncbi:MAG: hypothetical protein QM808_14245 [Steroidobacteraceae bacterium]
MKIKQLIATALLVASMGLAQAADKPAAAKSTDDNMIGLTTENGKVVYNFINEWWNEKKGAAVWEKYVSRENYENHAVYSAKKGVHPSFDEEVAAEVKIANASTTRFEIKQLVSQGSLVFAHIHAIPKEGLGRQLVMILRVRNGKITDHWDIHEALKEDSVVFDNLNR